MERFDLVIRQGLVVDGTGSPSRVADVGVAGARIQAIAPTLEVSADIEVDAEGLVVSPGFIDIHTHYDAQILWDPDLMSSAWHGVTTIVMGNCGFSIAPTQAQHRQLIEQTLANVEDISAEALSEGVTWDFETFTEYLNALEARPRRLNVAAMIGHTPLRVFVLGREAFERPATPAEVRRMCDILSEAMDAGALGFATSNAPVHIGAEGMPVPSLSASYEETLELCRVLHEFDHGVIEVTQGPSIFLQQFAEMANASGRPVSWTSLLTGRTTESSLDILDAGAAFGGEVWPQISCRPLGLQFSFASTPVHFVPLPAFRSTAGRRGSALLAMYGDPRWRGEARAQLEERWGRRWRISTIARSSRFPELVGRSIEELGDHKGIDALDAALDVALADDLATRFNMILMNDDEVEVGELLKDHRTLLGLSDAGAHQAQLNDACFSTHLLGHWVRERKTLRLEEAVWRLSGQPAQVYGIRDRGHLAEGAFADIVIFDPASIATGPQKRVADLPGGGERLLAYGEGVRDVWINGVASRRDGRDLLNSHAGLILRD